MVCFVMLALGGLGRVGLGCNAHQAMSFQCFHHVLFLIGQTWYGMSF